ncbi:hypothetical protein JR316_0009643 [Psilocybe cubensis]|uniref:Uncharacterized protein n=1 Tax=Psilocybe cubensis TaxID=181762 RepID=A0ACB8GNV6_PSICU|nr:hypothetical protein JR316_0009643 [Psilocybe cubensis]KAH9477430.1 hypothetical protein JR316_0009643 [Psilocybe cubensis]
MSTNLVHAPVPTPLAEGTLVTLSREITGKYKYDGQDATQTLPPGTQVAIGKSMELAHTRVSTGLPGGRPDGFMYTLYVELPDKTWWTFLSDGVVIGGRNKNIPHKLLSKEPTSKKTKTSPAVVGTYLTDRFFRPNEMPYLRGDHTYNAGRNGTGPGSTITLTLGDRIVISSDAHSNNASLKISVPPTRMPTPKNLQEAHYHFSATQRGEKVIPVWTSEIFCIEGVDFTVNRQ